MLQLINRLLIVATVITISKAWVLADDDKSKSLFAPPGEPTTDGAKGQVEIEAGGLEIKVGIRHLASMTAYDVVVTNLEGGSETLGVITTNNGGAGQLKIDTQAGDAVPFGVGSLSALEGFGVSIVDPDGNAALLGTVGAIGTGGNGDQDEGEGTSCLVATEAAPAAHGEVEFEFDDDNDGGDGFEGEGEGEGEGLEADATYDVELRNPADASVTPMGQFTTDEKGEGELKLKNVGMETLGQDVAIKDANGVDVLTGAIPEIGVDDECPEDADADTNDDTKGAKGVALIPGSPLRNHFSVVGQFDALFYRGDSNSDGLVDVSDSLHTLFYLFTAGSVPRCLDAADSNDDGQIDLIDAMNTLLHLFRGTRPLPAPGSFIAGPDRTVDALHCSESVAP